jgi:hypothetical protein
LLKNACLLCCARHASLRRTGKECSFLCAAKERSGQDW